MHKKLGILGGGQLGRMMIAPCIDLGVEVYFLDPNSQCSVSEFTNHLTVGDFKDYDTVLAFGRMVDVLTVEIEHVNVEALEQLESEGKSVYPSSKVLRTIQDKGLQKQFYKDNHIPTSDFECVENTAAITNFPIVQKTRMGGYDGQGVQVLKSSEDLPKAFEVPSVLESLVDIEKEIGVMVVRNTEGVIQVFPPVEMIFCPELNLVKYVACPSELDSFESKKFVQLAKEVAEKIDLVGILAVEFFLTPEGDILVNEVAPRVHNSGHLTIEGTTTSQFEIHVRAVMGLPLPEVSITKPSIMVNLVGESDHFGEAQLKGEDEILSLPGVYLHWYGKKETRPGRKMGHVTIVRTSIAEARAIADKVLETLKVVSK